jgi:undecaprenyl-diphosphatase
MTAFQALFIALLQGVTELFPISSLGHSVVLPALLGWDINLHDVAFLPFLTLLHLGTGIALLIYFRRDWVDLIGQGLQKPTQGIVNESRRLFWLLVLATIPAVVIGGGLEKLFRYFFGSPVIAAFFLVVNGLVLIGGEKLRSKAKGEISLSQLSWKKALLIGFSQALALFPGISRSGVTMIAGMGTGLRSEDAARFSFLLATPVIFAAAAYEIYKMHGAGLSITGLEVFAAIVAGITAYASVAFLMRYFGKHDFKALNPFGYYCLAFGGVSLAVLAL